MLLPEAQLIGSHSRKRNLAGPRLRMSAYLLKRVIDGRTGAACAPRHLGVARVNDRNAQRQTRNQSPRRLHLTAARRPASANHKDKQ